MDSRLRGNDGGTSGNDGGTRRGNDETCSPDSGRLATLLGGYGVGVSRSASLYPCGYTRRTLRLPDRGTAVDPGVRSFVGGRGGADGSALFRALESACWTARGVQSTTHRDRISAESGNQDDAPMDVNAPLHTVAPHGRCHARVRSLGRTNWARGTPNYVIYSRP